MASESDYVAALRALTGATGDEMSIRLADVRIDAQYFSGSSSHLVVSTPYVGRDLAPPESYRGHRGPLVAVRPLSITLRREDASDRRAKAGGVAIEAQTGDHAFDDEVYVDGPSTEEVVARVLASPIARTAIRELLAAGVSPVALDDAGKIHVRIHAFAALPGDPLWLLERIALVARHVPTVTPSGGSHPVDPWAGVPVLFGAAALVLGIITPILMFSVLPERCYVSDDEGTSLACIDPRCCEPVAYGAVGGAAVGLVLAAFLFFRIRGTSSAHRVRWSAAGFAFLVAFELAQLLAHAVAAFTLR